MLAQPLRLAALLLITAPALASAAEKFDRGLIALHTDNGIYVGWRLLASDPKGIAFHVYRGIGPAPVQQLTSEPISNSTNFMDSTIPSGTALKDVSYHIQPTNTKTKELISAPVPLEQFTWEGIFRRIKLQGNYTAQKVGIGDLDGDGRYDYVIKQPDFNVDPYEAPGYWKKSEDTYTLEAYNADGKPLWTYNMGWSIEEGVWYSPYIVYDFDGDGRAEVYAKAGEGDPRDSDGRVTSGPEYLVKINGLTGKVERRIPWPDRSGYEKYNYYCRNLLGIAYLDGKRPHLIVQRGTYTQIKVEAYDPQLNLVWKWNSRDEKRKYNGQGMHGMHAADVDADGRDEIILGAAVLDNNGKGLWTRETGHPDVCYIGDIDPAHPGLEIFYGIEPRQKRDAVCLVEAATGRTLWGCDEPTTHVHGQGMVADIIPEYPGQECYAGEKDRSRFWLYSATGKRIGEKEIGGLNPRAFWWDADSQKELYLNGHVVNYAGPQLAPMQGTIIAIADVLGDWREEVITSLPGEIRIYTTTIPAVTRRPCLMQDRLYRNDVAVASMGYYYPPQLSK